MIIDRLTWKVCHSHHAEFIESVRAMVEKIGSPSRICTFMFGPMDVVIHDLEFDTEEDRQKFWNDIDSSQPAYAEWRKKRPDLTESYEGNHRELLRVH